MPDSVNIFFSTIDYIEYSVSFIEAWKSNTGSYFSNDGIIRLLCLGVKLKVLWQRLSIPESFALKIYFYTLFQSLETGLRDQVYEIKDDKSNLRLPTIKDTKPNLTLKNKIQFYKIIWDIQIRFCFSFLFVQLSQFNNVYHVSSTLKVFLSSQNFQKQKLLSGLLSTCTKNTRN